VSSDRGTLYFHVKEASEDASKCNKEDHVVAVAVTHAFCHFNQLPSSSLEKEFDHSMSVYIVIYVP
jgi:hypothetical protein